MAGHRPDSDPGSGPAGTFDQAPAPAPAPAHSQAVRFLEHCHRRLQAVATGAEAEAGTRALAEAIERAEPRPYQPSWLPVLDTVDHLVETEPADDLTDDFVALAPLLRWIPTHRATDGGTELALAPLDQLFDLGDTATGDTATGSTATGDTVIGIMYIGPGSTYPLHNHPPQELYLTIAGEGRWRYGGNEDFEPVGPHRTLYNHPGDLHSAVAGSVPVVALYVLW